MVICAVVNVNMAIPPKNTKNIDIYAVSGRMEHYAARPDKGYVRTNNEDNLFLCGRYLTGSELSHPFSIDGGCPFPAIFGVFDGIGGEQCGERASMIAAQILTDYEPQLLSNTVTESGSKLYNYVENVNQKIGAVASFQGARMGTTAAIVIVSQNEIDAYNVGDSQVYTCVRGRLKQISVDHTLVKQKIDRREYTAQEARQSRDWGKLTACLGIPRSNGKFAEITRLPIIPINGTVRLLLCSDGISDMVPDNIIEVILRFGPPNQAGKKLMSEALNRGGRDNASIIIVDVIPKSALISRLKYSLSIY